MPKTLNSVAPNASVLIGNNTDLPSRTNPELALLAMDVLSQWSLLENYVNTMFVALLGNNPAPAAAVFASIRNQAGQRDAIEAVISSATNDTSQRAIIMATMEVYKKASSLRNKLAHWVWGSSPDITDGLLIISPSDYIAFFAKIHEFRDLPFDKRTADDLPILDRDKVLVLKREDFAAAIERVTRAMNLVGTTTMAIIWHKDGQDAGLYSQLSNEPEIRQVLDRQNKGRKTPQEA